MTVLGVLLFTNSEFLGNFRIWECRCYVGLVVDLCRLVHFLPFLPFPSFFLTSIVLSLLRSICLEVWNLAVEVGTLYSGLRENDNNINLLSNYILPHALTARLSDRSVQSLGRKPCVSCAEQQILFNVV